VAYDRWDNFHVAEEGAHMLRLGAFAGLGLWLALAGLASAQQGQPQPVSCPVRADDPLSTIGVIDGPPEEMAYLVPDINTDERDHWNLAYVYDSRRFVTLRCRYKTGAVVDIKISHRIGQCQASRPPGGVPSVTCN
jgi:hypothetical protein